MKLRLISLGLVVGVGAFALAGCGTQVRAEWHGFKAGKEICKAADSDNADSAKRHIDKAQRELDHIARFVGRDVGEDVNDIDRNLDQIARGGATQQDVNAITRAVEDAKSGASGSAEAAYDGILEGLAKCD